MTKGANIRMPGDTGDHIDHQHLPALEENAATKSKQNMTAILSTLAHDYTFKTPDDTEILHFYKEGIYVPAETTVKGRIEEIFDVETNSHFCYEVIEHFKRRSYLPREAFNNLQGFIPVKNGLLNLQSLEVEAHDSTKIFTFKVATEFNLSADCPRFRSFLNEAVPISEEQLLLQEFAGYTLLPAFPHHKFLILVGEGRNGKGTFIRTIESILGKQNVTNIRLEQLDGSHRFAIANLYGALMNICSEPATKEPFRTELLKQICGQDTLDAEIKNKQKALKFTSFAKFFVQANHLPKVNDTTLSFWDRVLILEFKQSFTDEKGNRVEEIEKTWLDDEEERSGILNWMLEGLKRLSQNHRFTRTKSQDEMILIFKQSSDPIGAFLTDKTECTYGSTLWVTRQDLYNAYKLYAQTLGLDSDSGKTFADRVRRIAGVADKKKRIAERNERVWKGLGVVKKVAEPDIDDFDVQTLDEFGVHTSGARGALGAHPVSPEKNEAQNNNRRKRESMEGAPAAPCAPAKALNEDVIVSAMGCQSWTWSSLSDEIVRLGYSREEFQRIFTELAEDSKLSRSGTTPVCYCLKDVIQE